MLFFVGSVRAAVWKGQISYNFKVDASLFVGVSKLSRTSTQCASTSRDRDETYCIQDSQCFPYDISQNFASVPVSVPVTCFLGEEILVETNRKFLCFFRVIITMPNFLQRFAKTFVTTVQLVPK